MADERKDCIDDLSAAVGGRRSRKELQDDLENIMDRAAGHTHGGESPGDAYAKVSAQMLDEELERAARARRNARVDAMRDSERHRWYDRMIQEGQRAYLLVEAKLNGVNAPFWKSGDSVATKRGVLMEKWAGGFALDLERAGLDKIWASRAIQDQWARELFEINKGRDGRPGITNNAQALEIANLIHKWQKVSIDALNNAGGWIKSYSGYITKTSHDADKIRLAGRDQWMADIVPRLDMRRTFGPATADEQRDILAKIWLQLKSGDHLDFEQALDEPRFANIARQASAHRELHFRNADDWLAYNKQYGVRDPSETVWHAFDQAARRTALMNEFGTKPREGFENDLIYLMNRYRDTEHYTELKNWEQGLRNRYNQLDYSANKPANALFSRLTSNWMALQRLAKLMRAPFTHIASLPTKAVAGQYIGFSLGERWKGIFGDVLAGAEGSEKRQVANATLAGMDAHMGGLLSRYDVADAPSGLLSKLDGLAFKLNGLNALVENSRSGFESTAARHYGLMKDQAFADLGSAEQRVLRRYGIGATEWDLLRGGDWAIGENQYLTPQAPAGISDEAMRAYLDTSRPLSVRAMAGSEITPAAITRGREDLGEKIHAMLYDQGSYAIFRPSSRTRAIMFQGTQQTSPNLYQALKLLYQFRVWPAEMIMRTWGRLIYGGQGNMEKAAAITELVVSSILFGTFAEGLREFVQGQDPTARLSAHPLSYLTRGLVRSGAGTFAGDYLFGEFDRHGRSILGSLAGPTFGQIEDINNLKNDIVEGKWSRASADLLRDVKNNAPMLDMWWTFKAFDYLVTYRLQEYLNPGYLQRMEENMKRKQGIEFWLRPSVVSR